MNLLERRGWLDIGQTAAKASILAALKVIHSGSMTSLLEKIVKIDKKGVVRVRPVSEEELRKMNPWKRKAWSTRVRRWLKIMPREMLEANPWEKGTKMKIKEWVKDNVGRRGEDRCYGVDDGAAEGERKKEKEGNGGRRGQIAQKTKRHQHRKNERIGRTQTKGAENGEATRTPKPSC